MSRTAWLGCALLCVACGKDGKDGVKPNSEKSAWSFAGFVDAPRNQLAIVKSPGKVGLMNGEAKVMATVAVTGDDNVVVTGNGDILVINARNGTRGIDASGRELWSRTIAAEKAQMGTKTFGLAGSTGSTVVALATGKAVHEDTRPTKRNIFRRDKGYLFADDAELWLVDEDGAAKWRQKVDGLAQAALYASPKSLFILRPDRTFEERDYDKGGLISKGTCEGHASSSGKASDCAGEPKVDLTKSWLKATELGNDGSSKYDYYLGGPSKEAPKLIARDHVGRTRWQSEWPAATLAVEDRRVYRGEAANAVAFVAEQSKDQRALLAYDDATGKLVINRPLKGRERLAGLAESCWVVVTVSSVVCIDAHSGADTWTAPTSGSTVDAWPRAGSEALVLDGNPLTLSRIDKGGRRVWQTEIGEVKLDHNRDGMAIMSRGREQWALSDVMAVVGAPPELTVLDLGFGKLTKVK